MTISPITPETTLGEIVHAALGRSRLSERLGIDYCGGGKKPFHELTDGFTPPEWAGNTFRARYDGLAKLETETHEHVHEENNILFPQALAARDAA